MGLGAPKRRNKLSHDPNNTAWSKSTENFGHRILSSQGWKPGEYLGASNAAHADHYTAANASHIRVLLREDNLGIGAKIGGANNAETFGLSTLSGIFGRLNGKSDVEVQKQQSNLRDAELQTYQARKYGFMNFVSGGLLVGDKMEIVPKGALLPDTTVVAAKEPVEETKSSKKRKAEEGAQAPAEERRLKRKKSLANLHAEAETLSTEESQDEVLVDTKRPKKEKRQTDAVSLSQPTDSEQAERGQDDATGDESKEARRARKLARRAERAARRSEKETSDGDKARLKDEKRARKEERRKRKEEKRRLKTLKAEKAAAVLAAPTSGVSTPTLESLAFGGSRHAVRQRYIQQKRMASLNPQALKEILMIKAQA